MPLKHGWMIFHPTTSFLGSEREWDGKETTLGTRFVHPNPWKFWNFLTCHYIFPLRIAGLIFFCLWAHTRIFTETTWQWLRVARVVFPVRVLFIFGSRYMPEIYRIFTVLYALIVPAKIIFFQQHHCNCVYGKSSGNHDLLQKAYPVSIEINPTVIGLW